MKERKNILECGNVSSHLVAITADLDGYIRSLTIKTLLTINFHSNFHSVPTKINRKSQLFLIKHRIQVLFLCIDSSRKAKSSMMKRYRLNDASCYIYYQPISYYRF